MRDESKQTKPDCPLIGQNGNIYNLVGIAAKTLKRNGLSAEATKMSTRVFSSGSYDEALGIIGEYVNITSVDEPNEDTASWIKALPVWSEFASTVKQEFNSEFTSEI